MGLLERIRNFEKFINQFESSYNYCTKCDANLELQKGYSPDLPCWVCKGCGEMLINPNMEGSVVWICDKCEAVLNIQTGFSEKCHKWTCTECGFLNTIDDSEIYLTNDEYQAAMNDPYKGLSNADALALSLYEEKGSVANRDDIMLVKNREDGKLYIKKTLCTYDESIYEYLMNNPVKNMPKICAIYKAENNLIVIEEYIAGKTVAELTKGGPIEATKAIVLAKSLCKAVIELHSLSRPIIHRDIKPSNVMVTSDGEAYLLDVNVAKWYSPDEVEDTRLLGTLYYAAPEQLGYGFSASTERSDIYALGMLINVMLTGKLPKEEKATGERWNVIEKCIKLEPSERYSDDELLAALEKITR